METYPNIDKFAKKFPAEGVINERFTSNHEASMASGLDYLPFVTAFFSLAYLSQAKRMNAQNGRAILVGLGLSSYGSYLFCVNFLRDNLRHNAAEGDRANDVSLSRVLRKE